MIKFYVNIFIYLMVFILIDEPQAKGDIKTNNTIEVIGVTPAHGTNLSKDSIPYNVQHSSSKDIENGYHLSLTDFINNKLNSVTINEAQNNPLQVDVQYRGYTISPLLGLPQGLTVYQNGIRLNEPFGDTINWDIIPESSIASINLIGGANPVFGLNTLGGALSITTKNGFTHPGHSLEAYGGSFGRNVSTFESGANNGKWGYYFNTNYFDEGGWRDRSPSEALNIFGILSYRSENSTIDLSINKASTDLIGNGALPLELLNERRASVFTSPDQTENNLSMINLEGTRWINEEFLISGNIFYRYNKTNSFNGDGSEYEDCVESGGTAGLLCEEGDDEAIEDQNGNFINVLNTNGTERDAINNISEREQRGFGATLQATILKNLFKRQNQFLFGLNYQQGLIDFNSAVEIASLNCTLNNEDCALARANRSTSSTGLYVTEEGNNIKAHNRSWGFYFMDTFYLTEKIIITASARYNDSHIVLGDRSTESSLADPEDPDALNGEHNFSRVNPAVGINYNFNKKNGVYISYSESSRAPTPIELLCSEEDAPCSLPNSFLADPPLEQVVTKSIEGGIRGTFKNGINYNLSGFFSNNYDDIIFGSTGGTNSSRGFFRNVGKTLRAGTEIGFSGVYKDKFSWHANYSYVKATFEDSFFAISGNHPNASDLNGDGETDEIQVSPGDRIPGIPEHSIKVGGTYSFNKKLSIGSDIIYNSNQTLRGDESNELAPIDDYLIVNLNLNYKVSKNFTFFAKINNLFNKDYETFGLLGEASEILDNATDNRFFAPGAPISGFVGVKLTF